MDINKIYDMTEDEVKQRIKELDNEVMAMDKLEDVQAATVEKRALVARREEIREARDRKARTIIMNGGADPDALFVENVVKRENSLIAERKNNMDYNENTEIRAFQKYVTGGMKTMTDIEQRELALATYQNRKDKHDGSKTIDTNEGNKKKMSGLLQLSINRSQALPDYRLFIISVQIRHETKD